MNNSKKAANPSNRYLKAKLAPFGRPIFWLSGGMLVLLVVIVWQYWTHPEWIGATIDEEDSLAAISNLNQQNNNTPPTTAPQTSAQQGEITLPDPNSVVNDPVAEIQSDVGGTAGGNVQQQPTTGIQQQPTPTNVQQPIDPQKLGLASAPGAGLVSDKKLYEQVVGLPELFPPLLGESNLSSGSLLLPGATASQTENNQQPNNFYARTTEPVGTNQMPTQPSALETAVNRVLSSNNPTATAITQANPGYPTAQTQIPGQAYPTQAYPGQTVPGQAYPGQTVPGQAYPGQAYPGQAIPGQAIPGQAYPGQAVPTQAYPGQVAGVGGYRQPITTPVPQTNPYNAYNRVPGTNSGVMNNFGQVSPGGYGQVTPGAVGGNPGYSTTPTVPGVGYNQVPNYGY